ncbi:CDP-glycerol--UDP-pyrophosphoryl-N-acetylglucosaminyl-N-acetylmannosamine glycerophosphotransferase, partial [Pseudomonas syringae pv. actinidifoliorum]|nr:CDP-glycerol--UDP-pyrophosphoryl-N-acetylglucosaminyl-N-acetylmannosamine glycerophosphotransferase [Pseudomonas syringae pv. actinidifoliorum]
MQFHQAPHSQLPLFEAFLAQPIAPMLTNAVEAPWANEPEVFSELS